MLLVDSCKIISGSTIQLVFQVSIVMPSILNPSSGTPITTLQILVLVKAFIMASKGAAEEYLAAKMRQVKEEGLKIEATGRTETDHEPVNNQSQTFTQCFSLKTEVEYYHQMGIGKKLLLIGNYLSCQDLFLFYLFSWWASLLHQLDHVQGSLDELRNHVLWIHIPSSVRSPNPHNRHHWIHDDFKGKWLPCAGLKISYYNRYMRHGNQYHLK